jgi:hypothetical protein
MEMDTSERHPEFVFPLRVEVDEFLLRHEQRTLHIHAGMADVFFLQVAF